MMATDRRVEWRLSVWASFASLESETNRAEKELKKLLKSSRESSALIITYLFAEKCCLAQNFGIQLSLDFHGAVVDFQIAECWLRQCSFADECVFDVLFDVCYRPGGEVFMKKSQRKQTIALKLVTSGWRGCFERLVTLLVSWGLEVDENFLKLKFNDTRSLSKVWPNTRAVPSSFQSNFPVQNRLHNSSLVHSAITNLPRERIPAPSCLAYICIFLMSKYMRKLSCISGPAPKPFISVLATLKFPCSNDVSINLV